MSDNYGNLDENVNLFITGIGEKCKTITKRFIIGRKESIKAAIIYIDGNVDKNIIDRDILRPLMTSVEENILEVEGPSEYLCEKYIYMSECSIEKDIQKAIDKIKRGSTVIIIDRVLEFIVVNTYSNMPMGKSEPMNESAIRGSKEGFVESLEINIGMIRQRIKDKHLSTEVITVGTRTQTDVALIYIDDIVDMETVDEIKERIRAINVDSVQGIGVIEQLIEKYPYTIFPQVLTTERPDRVVANVLEGRIGIILDGTPFIIIAPVLFSDFFQAVEDYYERTFIASFIRLLRLISVFIVITLPSIYLIFIRFNAELVPINLIIPIIQSRRGVPFPPLLEILSMEVVIEFLREGGLRLPSKIGQTLSVVGGFIIGDAAIRARIVSPATIVVVGVAAIGTFVIPNYEMSLSIRLLRFPILLLSNFFGVLGIIAGGYILIVHLYSLDSFGVPYCSLNKYKDFKDILYRAPLWKMNNRPESIPNNNAVRQSDFRKKFRRRNNEKGRR